MNVQKLTAMTLLGIFAIFDLYASAVFAKGGGQGHHGPPPEAYTVCEEKFEGDTASFESPHGDTVIGTCVQDRNSERLVLLPDNPPDHGQPDNENE